jgi:hypothetical protein
MASINGNLWRFAGWAVLCLLLAGPIAALSGVGSSNPLWLMSVVASLIIGLNAYNIATLLAPGPHAPRPVIFISITSLAVLNAVTSFLAFAVLPRQ